MTDRPCQKDVEPFRQCCCECIHHRPVMEHRRTNSELETDSRGCLISIQKGWACVIPAEVDDAVYDNWPEHSCGCELHTKETDQ